MSGKELIHLTLKIVLLDCIVLIWTILIFLLVEREEFLEGCVSSIKIMLCRDHKIIGVSSYSVYQRRQSTTCIVYIFELFCCVGLTG